jgi:hypothetical protein
MTDEELDNARADEARRMGLTNPSPCIGDEKVVRPILTRGELRAALAALTPTKPEGGA